MSDMIVNLSINVNATQAEVELQNFNRLLQNLSINRNILSQTRQLRESFQKLITAGSLTPAQLNEAFNRMLIAINKFATQNNKVFNGLNNNILSSVLVANILTNSISTLSNKILAVPRLGFEYLQDLESIKIGLAGNITAIGKYNDQVIELNKSLFIASNIIKKLQFDAITTAATSSELINTFSSIMGVGLSAGMTLSQIEEITSTGIIALKSNKLNSQQYIQELRDLVAGGIDPRSSFLATMLKISDKDIQEAKTKVGGLYKFLMEKLQSYKESGSLFADTLTGRMEALQEGVTLVAAKGIEPLFEYIKENLPKITNQFIVINKEAKNFELNPNAVATIQAISNKLISLTEVLKTVINFVVELNISWGLLFSTLAGGVVFSLLGKVVTGLLGGFTSLLNIIRNTGRAFSILTSSLGALNMRNIFAVRGASLLGRAFSAITPILKGVFSSIGAITGAYLYFKEETEKGLNLNRLKQGLQEYNPKDSSSGGELDKNIKDERDNTIKNYSLIYQEIDVLEMRKKEILELKQSTQGVSPELLKRESPSVMAQINELPKIEMRLNDLDKKLIKLRRDTQERRKIEIQREIIDVASKMGKNPIIALSFINAENPWYDPIKESIKYRRDHPNAPDSDVPVGLYQMKWSSVYKHNVNLGTDNERRSTQADLTDVRKSTEIFFQKIDFIIPILNKILQRLGKPEIDQSKINLEQLKYLYTAWNFGEWSNKLNKGTAPVIGKHWERTLEKIEKGKIIAEDEIIQLAKFFEQTNKFIDIQRFNSLIESQKTEREHGVINPLFQGFLPDSYEEGLQNLFLGFQNANEIGKRINPDDIRSSPRAQQETIIQQVNTELMSPVEKTILEISKLYQRLQNPTGDVYNQFIELAQKMMLKTMEPISKEYAERALKKELQIIKIKEEENKLQLTKLDREKENLTVEEYYTKRRAILDELHKIELEKIAAERNSFNIRIYENIKEQLDDKAELDNKEQVTRISQQIEKENFERERDEKIRDSTKELNSLIHDIKTNTRGISIKEFYDSKVAAETLNRSDDINSANRISPDNGKAIVKQIEYQALSDSLDELDRQYSMLDIKLQNLTNTLNIDVYKGIRNTEDAEYQLNISTSNLTKAFEQYKDEQLAPIMDKIKEYDDLLQRTTSKSSELKTTISAADNATNTSLSKLMKDYWNSIDIIKEKGQFVSNIFGTMEDSLLHFIQTGKMGWRELSDVILRELLKIQIRMAESYLFRIFMPQAPITAGAPGGLFELFTGAVPAKASGGEIGTNSLVRLSNNEFIFPPETVKNIGVTNLLKLNKYALGGLVKGAGTDTSDSILATVSPGSFVLKAATVKKIGVRNLNKLLKINTNEFNFYQDKSIENNGDLINGFANGGIVGSPQNGDFEVSRSERKEFPPTKIFGNNYSVTQNITIDARNANPGVEGQIAMAMRRAKEEAVSTIKNELYRHGQIYNMVHR